MTSGLVWYWKISMRWVVRLRNVASPLPQRAATLLVTLWHRLPLDVIRKPLGGPPSLSGWWMQPGKICWAVAQADVVPVLVNEISFPLWKKKKRIAFHATNIGTISQGLATTWTVKMVKFVQGLLETQNHSSSSWIPKIWDCITI